MADNGVRVTQTYRQRHEECPDRTAGKGGGSCKRWTKSVTGGDGGAPFGGTGPCRTSRNQFNLVSKAETA